MAVLGGGLAASVLIAAAVDKSPEDELVYIGTHGMRDGDKPGTQHGIYAARFDTGTGQLTPLGRVADLDRAAWLVRHPKLPVLYAVALEGNDLEAEATAVSFEVNAADGKLRELNRVGVGGTDATHLDLDAASSTLFSANHRSGSVSAVSIQADGTLGRVSSVQKNYGTGPRPRQSAPHAHGVAVDGSHRYVLSADFGADRLFVYRFDPATRALSPADPPFAALPPGFGPRRVVFHPNGRFVYLAGELTAEVRAYGWDPVTGKLQTIQTFSPFKPDFIGEKSAAEVVVSRDGRFLYLSLRGDANSIVVLAIDPGKGTLTEVQRTPSLGRTPWSFAIDSGGGWMLVTNAGWPTAKSWGNNVSGTVNVFKVDRASGKLSPTSESMSLPEPVTVVFHP
jgi:6-phosphogluconolactonase